jgi:hypothetical protein
MHLLLLMLRQERLTRWLLAGALAQCLLLYFMIFCRLEALWQALALLAVGALGVGYRSLWAGLRSAPSRLGVVKQAAVQHWPLVIVAAGLVAFQLYAFLAQDRRVYGAETRSHVFWHTLYAGTVSASPQLMDIYAHGEPSYSDSIAYMAVLRDLRARNDASPAIAYVQDGTIHMNYMRNAGVYDKLVRRLFLQMVAEHPFLVLKSFLVDKPIDQVVTLQHARAFSTYRYAMLLPLALIIALLYVAGGGRALQLGDVVALRWVLPAILALSLLPTLVVASPLIVDTLVLVLLLLLLLVTQVVAFGLQWRRQRVQRLDAQRIAT